jgi:hypothetical protein
LRQLRRLVAGAFALAAAGGLAAVPSSASTDAPTSAVTSYASPGPQTCRVTLPGGADVVVTDRAGVESAQLDPSTPVPGGVIAFQSAGDRIVLPMSALRSPASLDLAAYDTSSLAQRTCGLAAPSAVTPDSAAHGASGANGGSGSGNSGYTLGRLTVNAIGLDGKPMTALVMLANLDDNAIARTEVTTGDNGGGRISVPDGHYAALMVAARDPENGIFVIDPEFTVRDGSQVTLDARSATTSIPTPTTPRPTTFASEAVNVSVGDGDGIGEPYGYWLNYLDSDTTPANIELNQVKPSKLGHLTVDPSFEFVSPPDSAEQYGYHIVEQTEGVPAAYPTKVNPATLATVTRNYGAPGAPSLALAVIDAEPAWMARTRTFGVGGVDFLTTGASHTEYFSAGPDLVWQTELEDESLHLLTDTSNEVFTPGQHTTENFDTGGQHPAVQLDPTGTTVICGACADSGNLLLDIWPFGDNTPGHAALDSGLAAPNTSSTSLSLWRNGKLLADSDTDAAGVGIAVPKGNAHFELATTSNRQIAETPLSNSVRTTWNFTADPGHGGTVPGDWVCTDGTTDCSTLPLLFADYNADADLLNQLTPGRHSLALTVAHQEHSDAPAVSGASVSVSYDDGSTWQSLRTTGANGAYQAGFTVPTGHSGGFVAVRVSAWDKAGNRIDQTVTRAYQVK